eukprot:TRINITY_DN10154_c0_g1_i1.p1 TRINITY_DN10154_c0_g1~~TRINITY_DN10154_c0_g1_i1.p1  ORF type:complete len:210 (+),score=26.63 TRINITY_DN10154_c0_g1_i1:274-903(+)
MTKCGRLAALTNYLETGFSVSAPGRGGLLSDFLSTQALPLEFAAGIPAPDLYNGFNAVFADVKASQVCVFSNRDPAGKPHLITNGIHAISNHLLNSPWHKLQRGKSRLLELIETDAVDVEPLFSLLADQKQFPAHRLNVFDAQWEYALSSIRCWHKDERYGTRSSAVVLVDTEDRVQFVERSFCIGEDGSLVRAGTDDQSFYFALEQSI